MITVPIETSLKSAAILVVVILAIPTLLSAQGITVYTDANYASLAATFTSDVSDFSQVSGPCGSRRNFNDCISSIKVPSGWSVTVYADAGYSGQSTTFTSDVPDLAQVNGPCSGKFNDCVSSLRVSVAITILSQPEGTRIEAGQNARLSVSVSGGSSFSYDWYQGNRGDASTPVRRVAGTSATTDSFTTPPLSTTTRYWVRVGNGYASADGSTATVLVGGIPAVGGFAQVVSGGAWKTTFTLINPSAVPLSAQLNFYADDGSPLFLPVTILSSDTSPLPSGSVSTVDLTVESNGSRTVETEAAGTQISAGWAEVRASTSNIKGFTIFRLRISDESAPEATSPLTASPQNSFVVAYDNTLGFQTGMALSNTSLATSNVTITTRNEIGVQLSTDTMSLPGMGHASFYINDKYPVSANGRGTVEIQSAPAGTVVGIGLRFSPSMSFTSIPIFPQ